MTAFTTKFVLLVVALALLVSAASACSIANCLNCALANENLCIVCNTGYSLTAAGGCKMSNAALAPQSLGVAVLVVLSAMLTYAL